MSTPIRVPAITLQQPWAWACFYADPCKDVENRSYRWLRPWGPLLIHAGRVTDPAGIKTIKEITGLRKLPAEALEGGFILGMVQVTGCTENSSSPWAVPNLQYAWQLTNPIPASHPIPCRGYPALWRPPVRWRAAFPATKGTR